jgi:PKD repeat protein/opacity protein-like surface antigen
MKTKRTLFAVGLFFVFFAGQTAWIPTHGGQGGAFSLLAADQGREGQSWVRVVVRFAKIRSLPSAGAKVIREIGYGTMLSVLGENGDYFQVSLLNVSAKPGAEPWYVLRSDVEAASAAAMPGLEDTRRVTFSPAAPAAGQPLLFTAGNFHTPNLLKWDMGDGTMLTSGSKATPGQEATLAYAYAAAGQYLVRVYDDMGNMSAPPVTVQVTVSAYARSLDFSPAHPLANHPVAITALNFRTPERIAWDFGDGTEIKPGDGPGVVKASFLVSHAYAAAGTYTVKAYDSGGDKSQAPLTVELEVGADPRQIRIEPARAVAGKTLQFSALNFNTPDHLRWDMGDGTILPSEKEASVMVGSLVNYGYEKPGNYLVRVYDWDGDPGRQPVKLVVAVSAAADLAAAAEPTVLPAAQTENTAVAAVPARKKSILFKVGPYAGYFLPQDALVKEIYGNGEVLYGARLGIHVWQGFYFWLSAAQFKVISKTTFTGEKTTLTLMPISAFVRYNVGLGFFNPYAGVGFTYQNFKEEAEIIPTTKGSGSSVAVEAGFELKMNRHFALDFGVRFSKLKSKPDNGDLEIDLGGMQAGVAMLISF